jgi:hypothetical protein
MHPNRQHLEGSSGQSQNPAGAQWEDGFSYLRRFSDRVANCRVPRGYKAEDGYRLGLWVANQRKARATMKIDHRRRLEALPGWSWQPNSDQWEEGFAHLKQFSNREGHCRVPARWSEGRRRLSTRRMGFGPEKKYGQDDAGPSPTPRSLTRMVMECLFGQMG